MASALFFFLYCERAWWWVGGARGVGRGDGAGVVGWWEGVHECWEWEDGVEVSVR